MSVSPRSPAIFIGHGSPMNALDDNDYTRAWHDLGQTLARPKAILMVSAHWMTRGVAVTAMPRPRTIHDFGGFPQALFDIQYPAAGDPALAARVADLLAPMTVVQDQQWGLDHGTWSVLVKMYPQADVPVVQLSLDLSQPAAWHFELGRQLSVLRDEGVMLMASGNVVHNLRRMSSEVRAYDWAQRFNDTMRAAILEQDWDKLVHYEQFGNDASLAVPTNEHFLPVLYVLGSKRPDERVTVFAEGMELGAISMMSVAVS
ncbi:4,5-DOPA dioxygenase extradiol [Undibacterium sp. Di26W]|uniref:4,5-DOPA-extradiol-dioxygenase n=1 Tax=Undibacterium sp. Di26W TaxID=3413035 RepID=UPI003BF302DC